MLPNPNAMQEALMRAVVRKEGAGGKLVDKVVKAADKTRLRPLRESVKLSYRTAQKLKAEGVLA